MLIIIIVIIIIFSIFPHPFNSAAGYNHAHHSTPSTMLFMMYTYCIHTVAIINVNKINTIMKAVIMKIITALNQSVPNSSNREGLHIWKAKAKQKEFKLMIQHKQMCTHTRRKQ